MSFYFWWCLLPLVVIRFFQKVFLNPFNFILKIIHELSSTSNGISDPETPSSYSALNIIKSENFFIMSFNVIKGKYFTRVFDKVWGQSFLLIMFALSIFFSKRILNKLLLLTDISSRTVTNLLILLPLATFLLFLTSCIFIIYIKLIENDKNSDKKRVYLINSINWISLFAYSIFIWMTSATKGA